MQKLLFLYNPHAGKGKIKSVLSDIVELFVNADYEVTIHSTKGRDDAKNVTMEKGSDYDIVVASGGDGTLSEVINGIMTLDKKPYVGFIPTGTTNDFAMNFKISKTGVNAAKTVVLGKPFPYDIGEFNGHYFHYVASFGIFANVAYSTPQAFKNAMGRVAYILEGARSLAKVKSYNMKIEYDSNIIEDDFIFGMISNANSVGGFKSLTGKNVALNDGLFEVMLIKMPQNIIELQSIMNALLMMDMRNNYIYKFKASNIKIQADEEIEWTLDGEFGGKLKEVDIINHKQAIDFLVEESVIVDLISEEDEDIVDSHLIEKVDHDTIKNIAKNMDIDIDK